MDGFKEFQGKDLDNAIEEACGYFDAPREKLEIEIIQDAKSGIFGIVGARKAKVRARRARLREAVESVLGPKAERAGAAAPTAPKEPAKSRPADAGDVRPGEPAAHEKRGQGKRRAARHSAGPAAPAAAPVAEAAPQTGQGAARKRAESGSADAPDAGPDTGPDIGPDAGHAGDGCQTKDKASGQTSNQTAGQTSNGTADRIPAPAHGNGSDHSRTDAAEDEAPRACDRSHAARHATPEAEAPAGGAAQRLPDAGHEDFSAELDDGDAGEGLPPRPMEQLDAARLTALAEEAVRELVRPITGGRVPVKVRVENGRVCATVDWSGDAGLLIGREGQTLAALQYLASRIVSHGMDAAVRIQLDIGDYRRRQDDKLRDLAHSLAERARSTGRAFSTRPLSSYHRRLIHLALQDAEDIQTHSSGEGPLKRVVISRRRPGQD